jgi:hypothetical protein
MNTSLTFAYLKKGLEELKTSNKQKNLVRGSHLNTLTSENSL